ncbi:MAG: riboflavin biosynthesis protein RibF [Candidatus Dadabacteria bacterium]|nr:MAG: riboflavin biosynthesis protein RibF [Candidatus Dadabacteria bacterium]
MPWISVCQKGKKKACRIGEVKLALRLIRGKSRLSGSPLVATVGNFDGLHIGHRALLERVLEARDSELPEAACAVISFYPHPAQVLREEKPRLYLTSLRKKFQLLDKIGVDALILLRFDHALSSMDAKTFMEKYLIGQFNVEYLILGSDTSFGKGRKKSPDELAAAFKAFGRKAEVVPVVRYGSRKVGSGWIRDCILEGDLDAASRMLGRPYSVVGRVVRGAGVGRRSLVPTANIAFGRHLMPPKGVYAGFVKRNDNLHNAVINLGLRPTLGGGDTVLEAHVTDCKDFECRGEIVEAYFLKWLREEIKFDSLDALRAQIAKDIELADGVCARYRRDLDI